jgi:hypothetical protein
LRHHHHMIIITLPEQLSIKPVTSTVITIILQSTPIENNTNKQSARLINGRSPFKFFFPISTFLQNAPSEYHQRCRHPCCCRYGAATDPGPSPPIPQSRKSTRCPGTRTVQPVFYRGLSRTTVFMLSNKQSLSPRH